MQIIRDSIL